MNRSTTATCGRYRRASSTASSPFEAVTQRSTQGCWVSISRKPQCTTSWSSTTSTRRRCGLRVATVLLAGASAIERYHQPHVPAVGAVWPELDDPTALQRLERG